MAVTPTSLPPPPAASAAAPAPGAAAIQGEGPFAPAPEFALLLATGIADIAADMPADKAAWRSDDRLPEASDPQGALPAAGAPPVVAFVLASLNHPGAAPIAAGGCWAPPTDPNTAATRPAASDAPVASDAVPPGGARAGALPSAAADVHEGRVAAIDSAATGPAEASFAELLPAPSHAPGASHARAAAEPAATGGLNSPVGAPGWGEEIGHRLVWMVGKGEQVASLRLNPPDLGPLEIRVTLNGDQGMQASVQFASAHASVREAIQSAMPSLQAMFADAGIRLEQSSVSAESFHDQAAARGQDGSGDDAARRQAAEGGSAPPLRVRIGHALVDTFA